jgi:YbbR domain-containing protein
VTKGKQAGLLKTLWPFRHPGLKLLSLGLALLLWIVVTGDQTVERSLRVPLELEQFPAGLELQGQLPETVDVRVRGASAALSRMSAGEVVAVLDLRGARAGRRLFQLTPAQVRAPFGVEVVHVTPPALAMTFEESASRHVRIEPDVDGRPAPGYVVGRSTADPPTIEVVGPASAVRRANEALTEPVSVAGARTSVTENVTVGLLDSALRLKDPKPVKVTVQIVPAPVEHTVRDRPVRLRNLEPNLSAEAEPTVVDVKVRGSREALGRVEPDDVIAYVDLRGLGSGQYNLTVHADASNEAGVARINPATVQVRISSAKN